MSNTYIVGWQIWLMEILILTVVYFLKAKGRFWSIYFRQSVGFPPHQSNFTSNLTVQWPVKVSKESFFTSRMFPITSHWRCKEALIWKWQFPLISHTLMTNSFKKAGIWFPIWYGRWLENVFHKLHKFLSKHRQPHSHPPNYAISPVLSYLHSNMYLIPV